MKMRSTKVPFLPVPIWREISPLPMTISIKQLALAKQKSLGKTTILFATKIHPLKFLPTCGEPSKVVKSGEGCLRTSEKMVMRIGFTPRFCPFVINTMSRLNTWQFVETSPRSSTCTKNSKRRNKRLFTAWVKSRKVVAKRPVIMSDALPPTLAFWLQNTVWIKKSPIL